MRLCHGESIGKWILPSLIAICSVAGTSLAVNEIRVPLEVERADIREVSDQQGSRLTFPGSRVVRDFGRPPLPVRHLQLLVPLDRRVSGVSFEGGTRISLGHPSNLAIDSGVTMPGEPALREHSFNELELASSSLYPPVQARPVGDQYQHGYHIVGIDVYPVRLDQESGELFAWVGGEIVVRLEAQPTPDVTVRERGKPQWEAALRERLGARVANPDAVDDYRELPTPLESAKAFVELDKKTPSLSSAPVDMIIITNNEMEPEFQRLADHRTRLGIRSIVVTFDDITANYQQGLDLAETIRLYIRDAYSKWGVDFALLGGDTEIVPTRYAHSTFYPPSKSTDIPSDYYFGCLDGNWNNDGDAFFGEVFVSGSDPGDATDLAPEVSVGRAPVVSLSEAELFVDKVIEYEIPSDTTYQTTALLASEVLFPSTWMQGNAVQLDGAIFSEDLVNNILPCDPNLSWIDQRHYENYTAYPGSQQELKANIKAELNTGDYGVFNHIGHGFFFDMSVGNATLRLEDTNNLTNGPNYYLLYGLNCSSAAFDFSSIQERYLTSETGGSVASIGSSRSAFPHMSNNFQQEFYTAWLCEGFTRLGQAVDDSREPFIGNTFLNTSERWTQFCYVLLGDPAMQLWPTSPRTVSLSLPGSVNPGEQLLSVTVTDNVGDVPVLGAMVCFRKGDEDYQVAQTNISGVASVTFDPETLGDIEVWVSGNGVYPTGDTVPVVDPGDVALSVESLAISEDGTNSSIGNGNGTLEAGERMGIQVLVRNVGSVSFGGGTVSLATLDGDLTVVGSSIPVGPIPAGGSAFATGALTVDIATTITDGHEGVLDFTIDDGGLGSWVDHETILFSGSEVEVIRLRFDDSNGGNGNGVVDPLENVEVIVEIKNFGDGAVGSVTGTLSSGDPDVVLVDPSASFGAMPQTLDTVDNDGDRFVVSENSVASPNLIDLTLTDDTGRVVVHTFDLRKPIAANGLTQGIGQSGEVVLTWSKNPESDLLGYWVYRRPLGGGSWDLASVDLVENSATFRDQGLAPLATFEYSVAAVDEGRLEGAQSSAIVASTPPDEAGCFPLPLTLDTSSDLAIEHVDTDGVPDMVLGSDLVYIIDGNCEEMLNGDNDAQTFGPITGVGGKYEPASIALGDLDGDHRPDIVASSWDTNEVYAFDRMGNILPGWPVSPPSKNWGTPAIGDLDGDGDNEVVWVDTTGYIIAFHHDGTEIADGDSDPGTTGPVGPRRVGETFGRCSPALYDVDGDGVKEILFGSKYSSDVTQDEFYALEPDGSGNNAAGWPKVIGTRSEFLSSAIVADLDNNGSMEIAVICENDQLYVWEEDGSNFGSFPIAMTSQAINRSSLAPSIAVGDFTENGNLEMVVCETKGATNTEVNIVDINGNILPGWPQTVPNLSEASPVVGDIDGDGLLDVVFGIGGGTDTAPNGVYAWDRDGNTVPGFPIAMGGFARATPTITDFNLDGNVNIVLAAWDGWIHVWDLQATYDPELVPFPTFRGDNSRDGVYRPRSLVAGPSVPKTVVFEPNVPNPFNPSTLLRFELPAGGAKNVNLSIFDAAGRLVRTLKTGALPEGGHELRWNGRGNDGAVVSSGVYYARLLVDNERALTRKMTLLK